MRNVWTEICVALIGLAVTALLIPHQANAKTALEMLEGRWTDNDKCGNEGRAIIFRDHLQFPSFGIGVPGSKASSISQWKIVKTDGEHIYVIGLPPVPDKSTGTFTVDGNKLLFEVYIEGHNFSIIYTRCQN